MNKAFLILVVLMVIIGGAVYFMSRESVLYKTDLTVPVEQTSSNTIPVVKNNEIPTFSEVVINYSNDGYAPNTIKVKINTMVTFKNNSSKLMWPASAFHPTHLELPEFDALKGFVPGQSYSYTFTKVGEWKYHDHLAPQYLGLIIVE